MKEKLIEKNINLARKYAWDFYRRNPNFMEYEDLIQVCSIGLINAVRTYNESTTLSTYAYKCMQNAIRCRNEKNKC